MDTSWTGLAAAVFSTVGLSLGVLILLFVFAFALIVGVMMWRRMARGYIPSSAPEQYVRLGVELIPESHFTEIDGARLHYVQVGQGRDIVLLHGIGASVYSWRFLFPLLQTHYRVTAIDIAGFGASTKDPRLNYGIDAQSTRLAKLLEQLGVRDPLLVGSSMGGAIALWMARTYPERFKQVLTLAPATDSTYIRPIYPYLGLAAPVLHPMLTRPVMRQLLLNALGHEILITDRTLDAYLQPFRQSRDSIRAFFAATRTLNEHRLPDELRGLRARVVVLWGARDRVIHRATIEALKQVLPDAEYLVNEMSAHHPMEDAPGWVTAQIERFYPAQAPSV